MLRPPGSTAATIEVRADISNIAFRGTTCITLCLLLRTGTNSFPRYAPGETTQRDSGLPGDGGGGWRGGRTPRFLPRAVQLIKLLPRSTTKSKSLFTLYQKMKERVAETDPVQCEQEQVLCGIAGITSFKNGAK